MFKYIHKIKFCKIPAGHFSFGHEWNKREFVEKADRYKIPIEWLIKEVPTNRVLLEEFEISETQITVGMMSDFYKDNPKFFIPEELQYNIEQQNMELPAYPISYETALAFCSWLSFILDEVIDLPTESEWEKCAKGIKNNMFPWGNAENHEIPNIRVNGIKSTPQNVKSHAHNVSDYGVYDLAGNVEEWTKSFNKPYKNNKIIYSYLLNYPILRGGTCEHGIDLARSTRRHGNHPSLYTGFRIVKRSSLNNLTSDMYELNREHRTIKRGDLILGKISSIGEDHILVHLLNDIYTKVSLDDIPTHVIELFGSFKNKDSEILLRLERVEGETYHCIKPTVEEIDEFIASNRERGIRP
jgi:formylglycine-generating enzyme required for sulfatase activity